MRWVKTSQLKKERKRTTRGLGKVIREKTSQPRKVQKKKTGKEDR